MATKSDKQKLLLEYLVSSVDTFALCKSIIRADFFDPEYRKSVEFLEDYYNKYSALPSLEQIKAETGLSLSTHQITRDQLEYTTTEIEAFCKKRAFEKAVYAAPEIVEKGDYGKAMKMFEDALTVSLQKDLGINYFEDPLTRLEKLSTLPSRTPMGLGPLDDLMQGGLARTEMILFCGKSGGGKSLTLSNLAYNFVERGFNVLYLTLELSEELVTQRFDMMWTGVPTFVIHKEYKTVAYRLNQVSKNFGMLTVKWMPSMTNSNAIRAYLKEYELKYGHIPDVLLVDYLDKMGTNSRVDPNNIWLKDKLATEELYDVGKDYNLFMATASQLNRAGRDADEIQQSHTAGGISKVDTVDWQWAILLTPAMKAAGEVMFQCLKARSSDAEGKAVVMDYDSKHLRFVNPKKEGEDDGPTPPFEVDKETGEIIEKKTFKGLPGKSKKSILDIMDMP
jgi:replicative DNA helicase